MAVGKEIRGKIKSIKSTQKITRAMEMVAASKMRKAQGSMFLSRPYSEKIRNVISHLAMGHSEYNHSYFQVRDIQRVGVILISSDRGLCGGLNVNAFRFLLDKIAAWDNAGVKVDLGVIGSKGMAFFKRLNLNILASTTHLGDNPSIKDVIGPVGVMLKAFEEKKLDAIYLVYSRFVNSMVQEPTLLSLLPIAPSIMQVEKHIETKKGYWDYIYEPDAKELLDMLLTRFIESQVYQGAVENFASEQAARMVAMKAATDNAGEFINELQLVYNKARQASITQELSEIVGGAAAV